MRIIIDIPEDMYRDIKNSGLTSNNEEYIQTLSRAIQHKSETFREYLEYSPKLRMFNTIMGIDDCLLGRVSVDRLLNRYW